VLLRAKAPRATSLPTSAAFTFPAGTARFVRVRNSGSTALAVGVRDPAGVADVTVASGRTQPIGSVRIKLFDVTRVIEQIETSVATLARCTVTVTRVGPPAELDGATLDRGAAPDGFAVQVDRGVRRPGWSLWAGTTAAHTMAMRLVADGTGVDTIVKVLLTVYPDQGVGALFGALAAAGFSATEAAAAVANAMTAITAPGMAQAIKAAYVDPMASLQTTAQQRAGWGWRAQQAAPALMAAFPATPTGELARALAAFPATTATALLAALALGAASRPMAETAVAIRTIMQPQTDARTLAGALRAAYPDADVTAQLRLLLDGSSTPAQAASALHQAFPELTPTQIGALLAVHDAAVRFDPSALAAALAGVGATPEQAQAIAASLLPNNQP
jgi:hypothetical protein